MFLVLFQLLAILTLSQSELILESEESLTLNLLQSEAKLLESFTEQTECETKTYKTDIYQVLFKEEENLVPQNYSIGNQHFIVNTRFLT